MAVFLISLGLVLLAVTGLSLGAMLGRAPIKGSCGGLSCVEGADCTACPKHAQQAVRT